jgi:hypothetical protein
MPILTAEFGYYPRSLDFATGRVSVATLPDLAQTVADIEASETVDGDWIYPGPQRASNWGDVSERPYPARVFGLPKTHRVEHSLADSQEHLDFHVWALAFFLGMRLTTTEAGFLDTTPIKPGKLVDFGLLGKGIEAVPILAENFWISHRADPAFVKRWVAAVHALFIAQHPQSLQFERFLYLYTALDACYALAAAIYQPRGRIPHFQRIDWLCKQFGMTTPGWADPAATGTAEVADIRNPTLHEALFMGEPLGFAIHGIGSSGNLTLEMKALVCRFLVKLIGGNDASYIQSATNTRQRRGLRL